MNRYRKNLILLSSMFSISSLLSCSLVNDISTYSKKSKEEQRFKITWNDGNGKEIYSDYVDKGVIPEYKNDIVPSKNSNTQYSYKFNNNWEPNIEPAIRDITYTAQFDSDLNKYWVNFYNGNNLLELEEYQYGEIPTFKGNLPEVIESDDKYETRFMGWDPKIDIVTNNTNYYAIYKRVPKTEIYKVTFELNNGLNPIVEEYAPGQHITYPANPTKIGYTFANWDYVVDEMPENDLTIKALYSLSLPGQYSWDSENAYSLSSGGSYSLFTSYDDLISSQVLKLNTNNEITSYTPSKPSILVLPDTVKGIRTINNSNLKELYVNTTSSFVFTFYSSCLYNSGIIKLFVDGDGKVTFPAYSNNIDNGYFNKNDLCFNNTVFTEAYFTNKQDVLNTASLSNQNTSLLKLTLPNTLKKLYFYSFFNTGMGSNTQYGFVSSISIKKQTLPSSLTHFYYINTSNPFKSYTIFNYEGNKEKWQQVEKKVYLYSSTTSIRSQTSFPSDVKFNFR